MRDIREKILNLILPLSVLLSIVVLWVGLAILVDNQYLLPSVSQTVNALYNLVGQKEFYTALFGTLGRSVIAFVLSFGIGSVLGIISLERRNAERIIQPVMALTRALPTIAVVLLLLFWTTSKIAPIIVTALVVLPTSYTHVKSAFLSVDKTSVEAGMVDGANKRQIFTKIRLPQAMPSVYNAIGSGLSLNLKLMVAAEVLSSTANSIGYLLNTSKVYFEIAQMLAIVMVMVVLGCIIETSFLSLSKKASSWR